MDTLNFNSSEYLPNSKERLKHLRRIINGRPVAILAAGPSIKELEERITELAQVDICYFGMNYFFVQENYILNKINKRFSVLFKGIDEGLPVAFNKIADFLERKEDNLLTSTFYGSRFDLMGPEFDIQKFLNKYDQKLFFLGGSNSTDRSLPNNSRLFHFINGNALSWLIYLAVIGKASKIVLFGADGYTKSDDIKKTYYRSDDYGTEPQKQLMENTNKGFNPIVPVSLKNIYETYGFELTPILNCSEVSFLTPFPKVTYNDAFDFLVDKKGHKEISDLRTPTASVIISGFGSNQDLEKTINNIKNQSYSNYEIITVQNRNDRDFLNALKNAISSAKGNYIFYCPPGTTLPDRDWINSCLEILENRPRISLVAGIDKNNELPWPKKGFLYYWLKKKTFFPANLICVRKEVLKKCLLQTNSLNTKNEFENWLNFNLRFNMAGYLPAFIPIATEQSKLSENNKYALNTYQQRINDYKKELIFRKKIHSYKDGEGNILSGKFYLSVLLFYDFAKKVKNKLPRSVDFYLNTTKRLVRKLYQR